MDAEKINGFGRSDRTNEGGDHETWTTKSFELPQA